MFDAFPDSVLILSCLVLSCLAMFCLFISLSFYLFFFIFHFHFHFHFSSLHTFPLIDCVITILPLLFAVIPFTSSSVYTIFILLFSAHCVVMFFSSFILSIFIFPFGLHFSTFCSAKLNCVNNDLH